MQRLENTVAKQDQSLKEKDDTISGLKELRDNMKTELENAKKKNKGQWEEIQREYLVQKLGKIQRTLNQRDSFFFFVQN